MVVEHNGGEGRHVYLVFVVLRDMLRQFGIQCVYAFNDEYGRKGLKYLEDSEDYRYFVENCREMIKMSQTNPTLRAELYREIGEFEQCVQYLDSIEPVTGYENEVREQIRKRALDGDRMVFQLG